jgi:hypothetical protein
LTAAGYPVTGGDGDGDGDGDGGKIESDGALELQADHHDKGRSQWRKVTMLKTNLTNFKMSTK